MTKKKKKSSQSAADRALGGDVSKDVDKAIDKDINSAGDINKIVKNTANNMKDAKKISDSVNDGTNKVATDKENNQMPDRALEQGAGLPFAGSTAGQLVNSIMYKFILGDLSLNNHAGYLDLLYHYNSGGYEYGVRDLINVAIPGDASQWILNGNKYNIFNVDESMVMDPQEYMSYSGSILQFIRDISNQPFNEIFWTYEEGDAWEDAIDQEQVSARNNLTGTTPPNPYETDKVQQFINIPRATMHFRQTPFEPSQWLSLPMVNLSPDEIISTNFDINDTDQSSVFNLLGSEQTDADIKAAPPVTDDQQELQRRYGYKYMEVQSDYFTNAHSNLALSDKEKARFSSASDEDELYGNTKMSYPSFETFCMYFVTDSSDFKPHDCDNMPIAEIDGGDELYNFVAQLLEDNFVNIDDYERNLVDQIDAIQKKADAASGQMAINYKITAEQMNVQLRRYQMEHSIAVQQQIVTSPLNVAKYVDDNGNLQAIPGKYIISYQAASNLINSFYKTVLGDDSDGANISDAKSATNTDDDSDEDSDEDSED